MTAGIALLALLFAAGWHDIKSRRIPNALVVFGIALGVLFQSFATSGMGLFSREDAGGLGATAALLGTLTGLAVFMPFYALRTLGAGDVKLLAMVGTWLGSQGVVLTALWTMACGGVLALVVMAWTRQGRRVLGNVRTMLTTASLTMPGSQVTQSSDGPTRASTTGRLPYALAIAAGTVIEVGRHWL